jgi:dolichol kinase
MRFGVLFLGKMMVDEDALELRRKTFHLLLGLVVLFAVTFGFIGIIELLFLLLIGAIISYFTKRKKLPFFSKVLKWFERPLVMQTIPGKGALFLILGFVMALILFPRDIALAAIAIITVGDSVSHLVGRFGGSVPHPWNTSKMIEGTMLGTFCAFLIAMFFVNPVEAFVASFIAMFFEAIEMKVWRTQALDDNLLVPLLAGIVIILMRLV